MSEPSDAYGLEIRSARPGDEAEILELLSASLGWNHDDRHLPFFRWKHHDNPFGRSPTWVADADGVIVGVRILLRWRFRDATGGTIDAVRAVDTATHPAHQGRGIFRQLTLAAIEELATEGVEFVFNTPNDRSRPGYLKMGWRVAGRVRVSVRPRGPMSLVRMARSRAPAEKWGLPCERFESPNQVFEETGALLELLDRCDARRERRHTDRTAEYVRWRYGFAPLHYRALPLGREVRDGVIVFRLRRRGALTEAAIAELLVTPEATATVRRGIGRILSETGADVAIAVGDCRSAMLPVPGIGPLLTVRELTEGRALTLTDLDLTLGDVELF